LDLDRQRALRIRWADEHISVFPLAELRRACPCAACRTARQQERTAVGLPVVPAGPAAEDMVKAESAELVGNYALRIRWRDGHDVGIYDFSMLRALDVTAPRRAPAPPETA
jgi:DUF971 family protein